jgi:diacylglycerol kinase (ATP)
MAKPGETGFKRIISACIYSWRGLKACWQNEAAFRQEVICSIILIPLGLYLGESAAEKVLLAGVCFLVMIVELLNSGIEAIVDKASPEHHHLAGRAKDLGSAAVFMGNIFVALTWITILFF